MKRYTGKVGVIQRVLPHYRAGFFDMLAGRCDGGLAVFAGEARAEEAIQVAEKLESAKRYYAKNRHFLSGRFYFCWQGGLIEWLEEWNPDTLIVEANPRYLSSRKALRWMGERGRPVIAWGLGSGINGGALARISQNSRKRFLRRFEAAIAYSEAGRKSFESLDIPGLKTYHAANATLPKPSKKLGNKKARGMPRVLFVGRLQARKGIERLIRASAAIQAEFAHELHIVGDGPEREILKEIASEVNAKVHFAGALTGEDLKTEFQGADLFVLPGTGGLAIQEAMSFGLPIIAGEGDGTQHDLIDESNGWLLTSSNTDELTRVLLEALGNREKLLKKGKASHQKASEEFNLEKMTDVFVQALLETRS